MRHTLLLALAMGCGQVPQPLELLRSADQVDVRLVDERVLGDEVEPLAFDVKLYDERTSWYLPAYLPTESWGPILLADSVLRESGDEALVSVAVSNLTWGHPAVLDLTFWFEAQEGRTSAIAVRDTNVQPGACTVTVTRFTTDAAHAAHVAACVQAWSDANGAPAGLHLQVAGRTTAPNWSFAANYTLDTHSPTQAGCTGPQVVGHDADELPEGVQLADAALWGVAQAGDTPISVVTWENTFRGQGWGPSAGGVSTLTLAPGERRALRSETFPAHWAEESLLALDEEDGFLDACVVMVHDGATSDARVDLTATLSYTR